MNNMRTENWCGYEIRFVEMYGEWWAILKDVCDALHLRTDAIAQRLDPDLMIRVKVEVSDHISNGVRSRGENKTRQMLAVNEQGVYEALFTSRKLEARKFRRWAGTVMKKFRTQVGLQGYEVMRMADKDIQDQIDHIIDTLFFDEQTGKLMQSITVQGGDVEQVEFLDN